MFFSPSFLDDYLKAGLFCVLTTFSGLSQILRGELVEIGTIFFKHWHLRPTNTNLTHFLEGYVDQHRVPTSNMTEGNDSEC